MTDHTTRRRPFAAVALASTLICGAGAASAATVQVTLDFGQLGGYIANPYVEDGFEVSGSSNRGDSIVLSTSQGNPKTSILLSTIAPSFTLTRSGGGAFSLIGFDYSCLRGVCNFSVGDTEITSGSSNIPDFATASPVGITDVKSLKFTLISSGHLIDNIVLSYDDGVAPIPLPAGLPLLLGGLAGLGLAARRKGGAA